MTPESRGNLICRFLINLPCKELSCMDRLLYHLDAAYWFYLDTTYGPAAKKVCERIQTAPVERTVGKAEEKEKETGASSKTEETRAPSSCNTEETTAPSSCNTQETTAASSSNTESKTGERKQLEWFAPASLQGSRSLATFVGRQDAGAPEIASFIWDLLGCEEARAHWSLHVPSSVVRLRELGPKAIQPLYLEHLITYRYKIPVAGCAIVRAVKDRSEYEYEILLIRASGQQSKDKEESWGIPKGKLNKNETPQEGAARETFEEVGWEPPSSQMSSILFDHKNTTVFFVNASLIASLPRFKPMCPNEISEIRWHPLTVIPPCRLTSLTRRIWPQVVKTCKKQNLSEENKLDDGDQKSSRQQKQNNSKNNIE